MPGVRGPGVTGSELVRLAAAVQRERRLRERMVELLAAWESGAAELDRDEPEGSEEIEQVGMAGAYRECALQVREVLFGAG